MDVVTWGEEPPALADVVPGLELATGKYLKCHQGGYGKIISSIGFRGGEGEGDEMNNIKDLIQDDSNIHNNHGLHCSGDRGPAQTQERHLKPRWRNFYVLVFDGLLLNDLLGIAPSTFAWMKLMMRSSH